jgi:hypothetical protein
MGDRSAWWRTSAGLAAWLVLAVTTTGVAWAAVRVVSNQGADPSPVAVPAAAVTSGSTAGIGGAQPAQPGGGLGTSSPSIPAAESPSASRSAPHGGNGPPRTSHSSQVFASPGGTVSVICTGLRRIHLVYASPADGWHMTVDSSDAEEIEVEFERGDADLHTQASCEDGTVEGEVKAD